MEYIDKDALVAEIESKKKYAQTLGDNAINNSMQQFYDGMKQGCVDIFSFIDTLEVKEVDLEKDVRQILSLYYEGIKHYEDIIKEEREENGGSDLAIKIMNGVVDARELGIQYVIDKLKVQKGE